MSLTGDFGALDALIAKFDKASDPSWIGSLSTALGAEALSLVQAEFGSQSDPFGDAWAPLKVRAGMILSDTGRLRGSVTMSASSSEMRVKVTASYGRYHQTGTSRMPKRQILPNEGQIPAAWLASFTEATTELVEHLFK